MFTTEKSYVVVGAGMSGLLAALLAKQRQPDARIVLVEQSSQAGGEYRGVDLPGFGYCDRAMRVIYETGFPEFDELLHGLLPESDWHILADNRKDIVGLFWRGQLQTSCQYLDLRRLPQSVRQTCEQEILHHAGNGKCSRAEPDAEQFLAARFGNTTAGYLSDALEKLYGIPATMLDPAATRHPAMNRVILYSEDRMQPVLASEAMRAVIAWPEQLTFPLKRQPAQAGLYPRQFGMTRVIEAAVRQLQQKGVRVLLNRRVAALDIKERRIAAVQLDDGECIEEPTLVVSANGLHGSLRMLDPASRRTTPPPRGWMVFLRSVEPPAMGELYHFFVYDPAYRSFRVTNYAQYCPEAQSDSGYPLCVELWSDDETAEQAQARALQELRGMGVLNGGDITAQGALASPNYHALGSMAHMRELRELRAEIAGRSPENMITVGPFMEDGVMLLFEVWRAMYLLLGRQL